LVHEAGAHIFTTPTLLARLETAGLVTRRYVIPTGSTVACTVDAADLIVLTVLEADLTGVTRVDVDLGDHRVEDVPFEGTGGRIAFIAPGAELRRMPSTRFSIRAVARDERGNERTIGTYVLDHTAFAGAH
jgi:hypothetical protein